jgi:selenoprotein W-related protein
LTKQFENDVEVISLIPSDGGRFEVALDDQLVFSKKQLGRHAEEGEVLELFRDLVPQEE